jgi:hypothetical protein
MAQIAQSTIDTFRSMEQPAQLEALGRMPPELKQTLLTALQDAQPAPGGGVPEPEMKTSTLGTLYGGARQAARQAYNAGKGVYDVIAAAGSGSPDDIVRNPDARARIAKGFILGGPEAATTEMLRPGEYTNLAARHLGAISAFFGGDPESALKFAKEGDDARAFAALWTLPVGTAVASYVTKFIPRLGKTIQVAVSSSTRELNALSAAGRPSPRINATPQAVAQSVQPLLRQVAEIWGIDPASESWFNRFTGHTDTLPSRGFNQTVTVGEGGVAPDAVLGKVLRGGTDTTLNKIATALKIDPSKVRNVAVEMAAYAARLADDTVNALVKPFANRPITRTMRQAIETKMEQAAKIYDGKDQAIADSIRERARSLGTVRTLGELNDLKILVNKETDSMFKAATPGQLIQIDASTLAGWRELGGAIKNQLYPEYRRLGAPDLAELLEREGRAIQFRDGIFNKYYTDSTIAETQYRGRSWFDRILDPGGPETSQSTNNRSILFRATNAGRSPVADLNFMMRRGIGQLGEGTIPESVRVIAQNRLLPMPKRADLPDFEFTIEGQLPIEIREGEILQNATARYNPDRIMIEPNPDFDPMSGPNYGELVATDPRLPSRYRPVDPSAAQTRANQLGSSGEATPDRSFSGPAQRGRSTYQQPIIADGEATALPVYPRDSRAAWNYSSETPGPAGTTVAKGPGTMTTTDPAVVAATVDAIEERIKMSSMSEAELNKGVRAGEITRAEAARAIMKEAEIIELRRIQSGLLDQLDNYYQNATPNGPVTAFIPAKPGTLSTMPLATVVPPGRRAAILGGTQKVVNVVGPANVVGTAREEGAN